MRKKVRKICFVGAPGTGKTVLAKHFKNKMQKAGYKVELAKEYARDFIVQYGPMRDVADQFLIIRGQREREKAAEKKNPDFVVCDCATYLAYVYTFLYEPRKSDKKDIKRHKMVSRRILDEARKEINNYDHVFFLPIEFATPQDGVRLYVDQAAEISRKIKGFLCRHKIKHYQLKGSINERMAQVLERLDSNKDFC